MNKSIVAPLALLATLSTLTSCTSSTSTNPVVPSATQTTSNTPVVVKDTPMSPSESGSQTPTPAAPEPTPLTPVMGSGSTGTMTPPTAMVSKTETLTYNTPGGPVNAEISLTFDNGTITNVTVVNKADNDISKKYQDSFAGEISKQVVGKKISELNLSAVGGASLTTGAFNKYIATL